MGIKSGCPPPAIPLVVQLGGGLQARVPELVPEFLAAGRPLLMIPGGGIIADAVRNLPVDDDSAHWMAIAAMDQYGWFIASRGIGISDQLQEPDRPVVFLPYCCMRRQDPLQHTWDITSDSIAAWVADYPGLDLLLFKPVNGITRAGTMLKRYQLP